MMTEKYFVQRAQEWAKDNGCSRTSVRQLRKWIKEGLLDPPSSPGQGQGSGRSKRLWSIRAYWTLLKILRIRRNTPQKGTKPQPPSPDLRLQLWLSKSIFPASIQQIKHDLGRKVKDLFRTRAFRVANRSKHWDDFNNPTTQRNLAKELRSLNESDPGLLFILTRLLEQIIKSPENAEQTISFLLHAISISEESLDKKHLAQLLTAPPDTLDVQKFLQTLESIIVSMAGIFSRPKKEEAFALRLLRDSSKDVLLLLRDTVFDWQHLPSFINFIPMIAELNSAAVPQALLILVEKLQSHTTSNPRFYADLSLRFFVLLYLLKKLKDDGDLLTGAEKFKKLRKDSDRIRREFFTFLRWIKDSMDILKSAPNPVKEIKKAKISDELRNSLVEILDKRST